MKAGRNALQSGRSRFTFTFLRRKLSTTIQNQCIGTYAYVHMYRAGTYAVWGEKKGDMRLVHMRLEEGDMRLGGGPYALWLENTVQCTPKHIRNGWKLSLVIKNTVWRRLRRAKVVF